MNLSGRFRVSVRGMMTIVAVSAGLMVLGTGSRTDYLSCHLCHNRKHVQLAGLLQRTGLMARNHGYGSPGPARAATCMVAIRAKTVQFPDRVELLGALANLC